MQLRIKNQDFQNESLELDNCITRDIQVGKKKGFLKRGNNTETSETKAPI